MKKFVQFLFVLVSILIGTSLCSAGDQDFVLINATGVEINALYVSPSAADDWGDDILGVDVLADGSYATVKFPREADECVWDFQVEDQEETSVTWSNIDLCKYGKITLHIEGEKVWATFE